MQILSKELSYYRKILFRLFMLFCLFFVITAVMEFNTYLNASNSKQVELVWKISPEEDVGGYNIYYDMVSRYNEGFTKYQYMKTLNEGDYIVGDNTGRFLLTSLDPMRTYWVCITAYDHAGNESDFSNEKIIFADKIPPVFPGCQEIYNPSSILHRNQFLWCLPFLFSYFWILLIRHLTRGKA